MGSETVVVVDLGFEVSEAGGGEIRWDLGGTRQHRGVGSARQEHPASDHTAPFFRRCGRPSWEHTSVGRSCNCSHWWLLCCTSLQLLLASAASEARGAGALQSPPGLWRALQGPPGLWRAFQGPPGLWRALHGPPGLWGASPDQRASRRPPLWQDAWCSPPPTSVFCPRYPRLGKSVKKTF